MGLVGGLIVLLGLCAITCFQDTMGIRLTEFRVPNQILNGQSAILKCNYDLEGDTLYAVKWYKGYYEFFRYLPEDIPHITTFPRPGVNVNVENSTENSLVLSSVDLSSTGRYRCEVASGYPYFHVVHDEGDMMVIDPPKEDPRMVGVHPRYYFGDTVRINCTSGPSKPAAELNWFINGQQANSRFLRGPFRESNPEGLENSTLGLEVVVGPVHFRRSGRMELKCLATIATVYSRSVVQIVEGDQPQ
ncbi:uncharacterized protein LOC124156915 [Ischnura elegans]|uniref:uncharacterized protein LOC124156915 n=1 Tax=Ischnura elegans TaxID=197161 RepID=UPI001ED8BC37|nr:uncharacterized protein LOC124156915 [Ischnura elegans]